MKDAIVKIDATDRVRPGAHKVGVIIAYSRSINKVLVSGNLLDDRHQITMSREGGMKT